MNAPERHAHEAAVADVLNQVLLFKAASLVIFRRGALIEFKTDLLDEKATSFEEGGQRSWQIGAFTGHHCHLDLGAVREVLFDAEPVSCQGGRLNYTAWFCGAEDCGNPYRPTALFSVTLNAPYEADGTSRREIIGQVYAAYDALRASPLVRGSESFLEARLALR
jgi:hypothetical protein